MLHKNLCCGDRGGDANFSGVYRRVRCKARRVSAIGWSIITVEVFEGETQEEAYFPTLGMDNNEKKYGRSISKVGTGYRSFFFFFQLGKSLEKKSHVLRFKFPTNTSSIIRCGSLHINNSTEMMIFLHRIKKL